MNDYENSNQYNNYTESDISDEVYTEKRNKKFSVGSQLLIVIQLAVCILILICAFVVKSVGGSFYATVGTWFYDNYNNSVFTDTQDNIFSFIDQTKTTENKDIIPNTNNNTDTDIISKIKSEIKKPLSKGTVTSAFGNRSDNSTSSNTKFHKGIDIGADKGSVISAMLDGTVAVAENDEKYGKYIVLTHSDNVKTLYAHCSELCVKTGGKISAGQKIALVGSTGDADGNHLHLEIIVDGENINPQDILGKEYI